MSPQRVDLYEVWVPKRLPEAIALLIADDELEQADRFRRVDDRRRFLLRRALVRTVLGDQTDTDPLLVRFRRAACPICGKAHGRPELEGHPSVRFSVSSSSELIVLAVASVAIGVDVEHLLGADRASEIASVLHPKERDHIANQSSEPRGRIATQIWARKEALLKGIGTGLARDPDRDFVGWCDDHAPDGQWRVINLDVSEDYAAAVALLAPHDAYVGRHRIDVSTMRRSPQTQ